jgi:chemotaxis protein MotB
MNNTAEIAGRLENRGGTRLLKLLALRRTPNPGQSWLIVYLDIITLMLAMFILLVNDPRHAEQTPAIESPETVTEIQSPVPPPPPVVKETPEPVTETSPLQSPVAEADAEPETRPQAEIETVSIEMLEPVDFASWNPAGQIETPTEPSLQAEAGMPESAPTPDKSDAEKILLELKSIAGEELVVDIKAGEINLQLPESILFETGKADLLPDAIDLLRQIVPIVTENQYPVSIEGHTDNVPIQTSQYPSNWELSAARATIVLRKLAELGIDYRRMKAIGYADTSPISDNNNEQGRRENRRVSIIIHAGQQ